jgi:hypothetical protein
VRRSLVEIGAVAFGQTPAGPLAALGLEHLQRLFNRWGADRLIPHALVRTTKALTSGTRDYTIGSGGDINLVRPTAIGRAGFVLNSTVTDPIEHPVEILSDQRWAEIPQKTLDGPVVEAIFYDHAFSSTSRGTISTYPTVNVANTQLVLYTKPAVVGYALLADDLEFPPPFDDAIHYDLARRLCRPLGRALTPEQLREANAAIAAVTLANYQPTELTLDPSLPGARQRGIGVGWSP